MRTHVFMALGMTGMLLGGCAGPQRYTQQINALKSDVGVLDQRVSQLERAGLKEPSASEWPANTQTSAAVTTPETAAAHHKGDVSAKPSKRDIQLALKNAGFYKGTVDGKLGAHTREAIRKFQTANGLKADGVAGRQTWDKLSVYLNMPAPAASTAAETADQTTVESKK